MKLYRTTFVVYLTALAATLTACGGGGGGGGGGPVTTAATFNTAIPSKLTASQSLGATSFPIPVTDYGMGTITFPAETWKDCCVTTPNSSAIAATTQPQQLFPVTHINDTAAPTAWASGWTGKGVSVTVIDDFTTTSISLNPQSYSTVNRNKSYSGLDGTYTANYDVLYKITAKVTHGDIVSNIAGGDYDGAIVLGDASFVYDSSNLKTCNATPKQFSSLTCNSSFYGWSIGHFTTTQSFAYKKVAGVAKESLIIKDSVNLSSSQNVEQTITYLQGHLANATQTDVINMSLGVSIATTGQSFDKVMASVTATPLANKINGVMVVAAGNSGSPCATADLAGCNAVAVAMAFQDATKDSTIVAGALEGTGSSENIATYSTRAGILANRFLLAPGATGYSGVVGTSFAAPRIAGAAAIIKQKYPNLTAKQIADVLLLSANKDINNSGSPSFSGAHPVYGQGKLDLQAALALAGAM